MILIQYWPLPLNLNPTLDSRQHHSGFSVQSLKCEVALCSSARPADPSPLIDRDHSNFVRSIFISQYKSFIFISLHAFSYNPSKALKEGREVQKEGREGDCTKKKKKALFCQTVPFGKHALSWFQWTRCSLPLKAIWMHRAFLALLETRLSAFDL